MQQNLITQTWRVRNEKQVQAHIFLSVDVQKTGTGNAAVAVPVPRFLQSGDFRIILVPIPVFHHIELKPAKFELIKISHRT